LQGYFLLVMLSKRSLFPKKKHRDRAKSVDMQADFEMSEDEDLDLAVVERSRSSELLPILEEEQEKFVVAPERRSENEKYLRSAPSKKRKRRKSMRAPGLTTSGPMVQIPPANNVKEPSVQLRANRSKRSNPRKYVARAIDYLIACKGYRQEGIFRQCGDYEKIKKAQAAIESNSAGPDLYEELGVFGVADLIKTLLDKGKNSLIDGIRFMQLSMLSEVIQSPINHEDRTAAEFAPLFINSVLSSLPKSNYRLLIKLLNFLTLVITHEEESLMGLQNVSTLFGSILFEAPTTIDYVEYVAQTSKQAKILENIFTCLLREPKMFQEEDSVPLSHLYASESTKLQNQYILKGEEYLKFYETKSAVYGLFHETILPVTPEEAQKYFTDQPQLSDRTKKPIAPPVRSSKRKSSGLRSRLSFRKSARVTHNKLTPATDPEAMMKLLASLKG